MLLYNRGFVTYMHISIWERRKRKKQNQYPFRPAAYHQAKFRVFDSHHNREGLRCATASYQGLGLSHGQSAPKCAPHRTPPCIPVIVISVCSAVTPFYLPQNKTLISSTVLDLSFIFHTIVSLSYIRVRSNRLSCKALTLSHPFLFTNTLYAPAMLLSFIILCSQSNFSVSLSLLQ